MNGLREVGGIGVFEGLLPHPKVPVGGRGSWLSCGKEALNIHCQVWIHGYTLGLSQRVGCSRDGAIFQLLFHPVHPCCHI
eukprot:4103695-Prorocentrum_lima.AAC.1